VSTVAASAERRGRAWFGPERATSTSIGLGLAVVGIATIALQAVLRRLEAVFAAFILDSTTSP